MKGFGGNLLSYETSRKLGVVRFNNLYLNNEINNEVILKDNKEEEERRLNKKVNDLKISEIILNEQNQNDKSISKMDKNKSKEKYSNKTSNGNIP